MAMGDPPKCAMCGTITGFCKCAKAGYYIDARQPIDKIPDMLRRIEELEQRIEQLEQPTASDGDERN